ncbi:glutamate-5-semialdehyde dehydrogenase [Acetivibrio ethanolgignens]|uniref:Gamma-glutamyl phosphate reductase n=1 Tax=Acetivibrio ethanolgignens TaxID=290052 RepID=A0A0V8QFM7_9FIRM|nr:glutamate-5-semialdehyde dehydrogenase [Acetivibrio ethanolgignens]KSV59403.1 gamma-glutamyl phosphate reductase [Acetivibrio ethanolgignens]
MEYLEQLGCQARQAARILNQLGQTEKNRGLLGAADALEGEAESILKANEKDVVRAQENGMKPSLVDRLKLTRERIAGMADGLRQVAGLPDPVGEVTSMKLRPNGLQIGEKRVPLGVVGIIYESRPNVTSDAFALCFKAGNAVILRGGSDAIYSNQEITKVLQKALKEAGLPETSVQLIEDTSRETVREFMRLNTYVDVLIPRGGAGLIKTVVENSTVPVIETGTGNCHIYVDETANIAMAVDIIDNAKTQRMGVCNACESLVIHKGIAKKVIPAIAERLLEKGVEIRGDEPSRSICSRIEEASEEDYKTEYLDAVISLKTVDSIDEAIEHINRCNTGHSEAIITKSYDNALKFQNEIDAAAVYVNASTRFTDGEQFGLGAEIGISTQKLHARGPMGLKALTTVKYIIFGNGQIRP